MREGTPAYGAWKMREVRRPYGAWIHSPNGDIEFYMAERLDEQGMTLRAGKAPPLGQTLSLKLIVENAREVLAIDAEVVDVLADAFSVRFLGLRGFEQAFINHLAAPTQTLAA